MKNKKYTIISIVAILIVGFVSFLIIRGDIFNKNNKTVAVVNGEEIERQVFELTKNQLSQMQNAEITDQQVIDQIITNKLLIQEAKEQGFEVNNEEIENQYQNLVTQAGGEEVFKTGLDELYISEEYVKNDIQNQILIQKYIDGVTVEEDFSVTDEEIDEFYQQLLSQQDGVPSFEDMKAQIKIQISQQKLSQFVLNIVSGLREKANINVSL